MPLLTARDRVLYWLEKCAEDTPPWDDLRDLIVDYDGLLDAALRIQKRGNPRERHDLIRCPCDICHDFRCQLREDAREPEPCDEEE